MDEARIQIMIPACNDVDRLDVTMDSIRRQNYNAENVYIIMMDFGSTDGTYEKMLTYDKERLGIYKNISTRNKRQMVSEMAKVGNYSYLGGHYFFQVVLYPGEILYPNCLRKCAQALIENQHQAPAMVICETDIIDEKGKIRPQQALFEKDRVINGEIEIDQYINKGFRHEVFCMGYGFMIGLNRRVGGCNEQRWWNKCAVNNNEQYALYIKEPLAAVNFIRYQDELEEILHRWDSVVSLVQGCIAKTGKESDEQYEAKAMKTLALYAVWRSYLLYMDNKIKDAEDCLLISEVIDSGIKSQKIYGCMEQCICGNSKGNADYVKNYFDKCL